MCLEHSITGHHAFELDNLSNVGISGLAATGGLRGQLSD